MKKTISIAILGLSLFAVTASIAFAQSTYSYQTDLGLGSRGVDVANLQSWLIANGYQIPSVSSGATTAGYFGVQTEQAVEKYQYVNGLPQTGFVGPLTREKLNAGVAVSGSYGSNGGVIIGANGGTIISPANPINPGYPTTTAGPLRITTPNGGQIWQRGTIQTITWTSPYYFQASTVDLKLIPYQAPCNTQICPLYALAPYTIATGLNANNNSYAWTVGNVSNYTSFQNGASIPDGQYSIQICTSNTTSCDTSDSTFTITTSGLSTNIPQINVITPNGGEVWQAGSTQNIELNVVGNLPTTASVLNLYLVNSANQQSLLYSNTQTSLTGIRNIAIQTSATLAPGQYRIYATLTNQSSLVSSDTSDNYFTVYSGSQYNYPGTQTYPVYSNTSSVSGCPAGYVCSVNGY